MQTLVVDPAVNGQPSAEERSMALPVSLSMTEMKAALSKQPAWLWHGYLAPGNVTLLTSLWKSGKTTLLSVLLAKLDGGELAGLRVRPSRALVLSEESEALWCQRAERLPFTDRIRWLCRPFRSKPRPEEWRAFLDHVADERRRNGLDLLVIDTLATFLPSRNENNAGSILAALLPLQALTALGLCVLILHHPRKGDPIPGQAARGSGALAGYVDIILEMRHFAANDCNDRRRILQSYSRHEETPKQLVLEWSADGTDYHVLGDVAANDFRGSWELLQSVLQDTIHKLTRRDILKGWPKDYPPPSDCTLWIWLERAVALGLVRRDGTGLKNKPFRYWLPEREKKLMPELEPLAPLEDIFGLR